MQFHSVEEHLSEVRTKYVFHITSCAGWQIFYVRLLAGKKIADLGMLVIKKIKSIFSEGPKTFNDFSFFCYSLHISLTTGWKKKLIMILLGEIF